MYAKLLAVSGIFLALALLFAVVLFLGRHGRDAERLKLELGGTTLDVEVARTISQKVQGLSGRKTLGEDEGMLFWYSRPGFPSFWMKDMHFPIDVIWLDGDWRVVDVTADMVPASFPRTFSPAAPAQYVLETNAGFAAAHGVARGSAASLLR